MFLPYHSFYCICSWKNISYSWDTDWLCDLFTEESGNSWWDPALKFLYSAWWQKTKLVLGPLTLLLTVGDCPSFILTISYAKKPLSRPVIHQYHKCISCISSLSLLWENSDCTYSCKEQVLELALSDFFKDSQQAETILEPSQNNEKQSLSLIAGQVCLCCTSTYVYCFPSMEL